MQKAIWTFLFALGIIFFNWPFMSIFKDTMVPYLFLVWAIFIIILFSVTTQIKRDDRGG